VLADEIDRFNDERREVQEHVVKGRLQTAGEKTFDGERDAIVVEAERPERVGTGASSASRHRASRRA
jgi:hypothetical protein